MKVLVDEINLDEQRKIREEIRERWKKVETSELKFEPLTFKDWAQYDGVAKIIEATIEREKNDN